MSMVLAATIIINHVSKVTWFLEISEAVFKFQLIQIEDQCFYTHPDGVKFLQQTCGRTASRMKASGAFFGLDSAE